MVIKYCHEYDSNGRKLRPFACIVGVNGSIGVSICNPKDMFVKKVARLVAEDRALEGDKSHFGPNPPSPNGFVRSFQYYHPGKVCWLTELPKALVIEQAISFVQNRLENINR